MIYLTGDLHGGMDIKKLNLIQEKLTADDVVIILGDFGLDAGFGKIPDWLYWLINQKWTTLFVDGNHDHFPWLNSLERKIWNGGTIGIVHDKVYHLRRGEVFTINNKTFFCMGGAYSMDKAYRKFSIDWFHEEIPGSSDWNNADINLTKHNYTVDYVLAHTMPARYAKIYLRQRSGMFGSELYDKESTLERDFDELLHHINFTRWFCGHWHPQPIWNYEKFTSIYNDVVELSDINFSDLNNK